MRDKVTRFLANARRALATSPRSAVEQHDWRGIERTTDIRAARSGCAWLLRRLRGPLRARDAGGADRGADRRLPCRAGGRGAFEASSIACSLHYVGRPTPLYEATRLAAARAGRSADSVRMFLKREDLTHTGAHKINNALGQALLARRMGKTRVVAETGRGPARRRDGNRMRTARARMRRLHGRGGHASAGAERGPHGAARRHRLDRWTPAAGP